MLQIATQAREVFDVTGAGDTVIAILAAAFGKDRNMAAAAKLANIGAGIVVGKIGTQAISYDELTRALSGRLPPGRVKVLTKEAAKELIATWRPDKHRIVFTNGCFDILHIGHIQLIHTAAAMGDRLVIGLNSDTSVRKLKGKDRPVINETERAALLASIKGVDAVVIFEEETPIELIKAFQPDILVKGGDYTPETVVGRKEVEAAGGKVVIYPIVEGASSTDVINKLKGAG